VAEDQVIKCEPQPFVILRPGKNENYLDMQEKDGVVLSVSYVECEFVMSEPTGLTNFAIGPNYLDKFIPSSSAFSHNKSAATMLKEREA
jgi:hypothetical protein